MQALFEKELMRMEQELRDLKTSHAIPVGSLNFYEHNATVTGGGLFAPALYVRITIDEGERAYPYTQVYVDGQSNSRIIDFGQFQSIEQDGTIIQFAYVLSESQPYNVRAISTSSFTLIAKPIEEGDWIGELPL